MRALAFSVVAAALALALGACAGSGAGRTDASRLSGLMVDQDADSASIHGYYDSDDGEIRSYGRATGGGDRTAIEALVRRYYAAAATGDTATACALTYYLDVETLPEEYGRAPGPLWLKGAKTCPAVLERVFAHFHRELTTPPVVTAVRVQGTHADAFVGFRTLGAGYVRLHREGAAWKVDGLLAAPLP